MVQGPYWAPAVDMHYEPNMLLVAAGIGITPYLSILHRLTFARRGEVVERQRSSCRSESGTKGLVHTRASVVHYNSTGGGDHPDADAAAADAADDAAEYPDAVHGGPRVTQTAAGKQPPPPPQQPQQPRQPPGPRVRLTQGCLLSQRATLVWTVRDLKLLDYFVSYIVSLATEFHAGGHDTPPFKVKLYFTGGGRLGVPTMVFNALAVLHYSRIGKKAGDALEVHIGRPDVEAEIRAQSFTGAYYCGSPVLGDILKAACTRASTSFLDRFPRAPPPCMPHLTLTRRAACSPWWPCGWSADGCLRSDGVTNALRSVLQAPRTTCPSTSRTSRTGRSATFSTSRTPPTVTIAAASRRPRSARRRSWRTKRTWATSVV